MFIDKSNYLQFIAEKLADEFAAVGWENYVKYRVRFQTRFADVRLFRSTGTDGQTRYFGMAHGYDTAKTPFTDMRLIMSDSPLGTVGIGDGENKNFKLQVFPVDEVHPFTLYKDGIPIPDAEYTKDLVTGDIVFKTAPGSGVMITASYKLSALAPEPPSKLFFFTYTSVYLENLANAGNGGRKIGEGDDIKVEFNTPTFPIKYKSLKVYVDSKLVGEDEYDVNLTTGKIVFHVPPKLGKEITVEYVQIVAGPAPAKAGDGDGTNKVFFTPTAPIAETGVKVWVDGKVLLSTEYKIDYETGKIELNTAPSLGKEVTVECISLVGGPVVGTERLSDLKASQDFNPEDSKSLMGVVYDSVFFLYPSIPTCASLSTDGKIGGGWQRDSLFYYWGNANKDRIMLHIRLDPSGWAERAHFVPLYLGKLAIKGKSPRRNMVILSGANKTDEIVPVPGLKLGNVVADYGTQASNGNNSVLLQQTLGGSYYQHHYLSFITHDQSVDNGDGRYQPSEYSNKYHFSRFRIVHPNDGRVGELDDMYAVHPKNIFQMDNIDVENKVENEEIGFGDGKQKSYHTRRAAYNGQLKIKIACVEVPESDYTYDPETKQILFKNPPPAGAEILADYEFKQKYRYTLSTPERCPFRIPAVTPFAPIGVAVRQEEIGQGGTM
jgi:hypothetical protein